MFVHYSWRFEINIQSNRKQSNNFYTIDFLFLKAFISDYKFANQIKLKNTHPFFY